MECQSEMEVESSPAPVEVTLFSATAHAKDHVETSLGGEQDQEVLCAS